MNFPILSMPRRLIDMENLFNASIDVFDPFDEFDQELCNRDLLWLRKPILRERRTKPQVPMKHRLNIDVHGYRPESLKTEIQHGKLVVTGYDEVAKGDDYTKREFRKTFMLPSNVDEEKLISFVTRKGHMIIEIPYKREVSDRFEPKIESNPDGSGRILYTMDIKNLDLTKLQITLKDYDIIINYEELLQLTGTKSSRITNVKRFKLPDNANINTLMCVCDNDRLTIEAQLVPESEFVKMIPIYYVEKEQEQQPSEKIEEKQPEVPIETKKEEAAAASVESQVSEERSEEPVKKEDVQKVAEEMEGGQQVPQQPQEEARPTQEEIAPVKACEVSPAAEETKKQASLEQQPSEAEVIKQQQKPSEEEERIHAELREAMQPVVGKEGKELIISNLQIQARGPKEIRLFEAPRAFEAPKREEEEKEKPEKEPTEKIEEKTEKTEMTALGEPLEVREPVKKLPFDSIQFHFSVKPEEQELKESGRLEEVNVSTKEEEEAPIEQQQQQHQTAKVGETEIQIQQLEKEEEPSRAEISSEAGTTAGESTSSGQQPQEKEQSQSSVESDLPTEKTEETSVTSEESEQPQEARLEPQQYEEEEESEKKTPVNA